MERSWYRELYSSLFCAQKLKALIVPFSRDRSQNCDPCALIYEPYGDISGIVTHAQAVDICQAAFSPAQPGNEAKVCPTCRRYLRHSCDILILHYYIDDPETIILHQT